MGLENLKSVFTRDVGNNNSQIRGRHGPPHPKEQHKSLESAFGTIGSNNSLIQGRFDIFNTINPIADYLGAVDFQNIQFGGFTHPVTDVPEGFTLNFNDKGVGAGNSKFLNFIPEGPLPKYYEDGIISIEKGSSFVGGPKSSIKYNQSINIPVTSDKNRTFNNSIENKAINELKDTGGWSALYNSDHTSRGLGYNYSVNVNQDNLSIRYTNSSGIENPGFSRNTFLGDGKEPYVVSEIGGNQHAIENIGIFSERWSSRSLPARRSLKDFERLSKFYLSPKGIQFTLSENLKSLFVREPSNPNIPGIDIIQDIPGVGNFRPQRFIPFFTGPLSTLPAISKLLGYATPNALVERDFPLSHLNIPGPGGTYPNYEFFLDNGTGKSMPISRNELVVDDAGYDVTSKNNVRTSIDPVSNGKNPTKFKKVLGVNVPVGKKLGDFMTLQPITKNPDNKTLTELYGDEVEKEQQGMPFYFKDLRDNTYLIFRGHVKGMTENIAPTWNPTNYIGRSEPVYIYESSTRDISFTLSLSVGSRDELKIIYKKLNKLTSLCYPQYKQDKLFWANEEQQSVEEEEDVDINGKIRMKPPLTKFRMGELFGKENKELTGFIKSIAYAYQDSSPWETEQGKRVPKYIEATIGYQVIHNKVPELGTRFYGYR